MGRMKMPRVGYFGGTIDPPHLGHLILASEAAFQLELDRVRWILTPDPPHKNKRPITPVSSRLEMLEKTLEAWPEFEISRVDLDREPPHYAADTVGLLHLENPGEELIYLIGEDSLRDLPEWVEPGRFLTVVDQLAVAPRPHVSVDLIKLENQLPGICRKVKYLADVMIEISSRDIRGRVSSSQPYRHFLPPGVADYIQNYKLYS
jgi:nicotinate-nucleotide adenylyltransferase